MDIFNPLNLLGLGILVYSAILHEIAHGYVAMRLGDPTARLRGRLTLDPRPHIDLYMTILLPLLLIFSGSGLIIGGAKPVPVDPFNFRDGRKDMALVALAGPLTNFILAAIASILLHIVGMTIASNNFWLALLQFFLIYTAHINVMLAIFNLLPIPPLDGSKVFSLLLPDHLAQQYLSIGSLGMIILFVLLLNPIGGFSLGSILSTLTCSALSLLQLPC